MSKCIKFVTMVAFVGTVAACASQQEEEIVVVEPVSTEPVFTGKYK
ncbi:hypothetical protein M3P21_06465 [Ruegeria sp. 2012CJ41-6]|uniref:Lipoprotein n=1 Tax=Ruegeria spongiae TaxID=2942209 RepID=A0ABT0Q161_9RHOB|nr:hypothetical protein [Ruegeria spongiae]MCL6283172.1 hypothetical protein [Ruegeria spongiae]